jgi:Pin2-interacting protein X1
LLTFDRRLKLSNDPNNTTWTKDTTGFGHKIMKSQGWEPGNFLGAKDAPHAEFHTEANASHIRVVLKDDNLGIGAKRGSGLEQGECVGLDVFQSLLGRLNGRDEDELAQEQKSREDLKRAIYTERKWGSIRFISGGFLIGDKIQDLIDGEAERIRQLAVDSSSGSESSSDSSSASESEATPDPVPTKQKKSKKSKRTIEVEISEASVVGPEHGKTKSKKKRKLAEAEIDGVAIVAKVKKSKKSGRSEPEEDDSETKEV